MIGKIKTLVLSLVAVAALAAVGASAAQAGELVIGAQPAVLTAHNEVNQQHVFVLEDAKKNSYPIECTTGRFEGTTTGQTINEWTVTPTYGTGKGNPAELQGCKFGGVKTQVLMNGCKYTFTGAGQAANTFLLDIVGCTAGKQIEIRTPLANCTIDISEQNGLPHATAKQLSAQEVTLETLVNVTRLTTTQTGAGCPDGDKFKAANTSFVGNTIVTAYTDSGMKQETLHQHQYTEFLCGPQVTLQSK